MVFQDPFGSLNPRWRITDIVEEPMVAYGVGDRGNRVRQLLDLVGLNPDTSGKRRPHELSGGQCQRVAIARAIALDPALSGRLLIADWAAAVRTHRKAWLAKDRVHATATGYLARAQLYADALNSCAA
jgi:ABC-type dipeptide/oligopeptide/nickel transport system ATPase subunit